MTDSHRPLVAESNWNENDRESSQSATVSVSTAPGSKTSSGGTVSMMPVFQTRTRVASTSGRDDRPNVILGRSMKNMDDFELRHFFRWFTGADDERTIVRIVGE